MRRPSSMHWKKNWDHRNISNPKKFSKNRRNLATANKYRRIHISSEKDLSKKKFWLEPMFLLTSFFLTVMSSLLQLDSRTENFRGSLIIHFQQLTRLQMQHYLDSHPAPFAIIRFYLAKFQILE